MKPSFTEIQCMLDHTSALPESDVLEYKEQLHNYCFHKYLETICAFMNGNGHGGYLIFGIKDNLTMPGLNTNKSYDNMILKFDSIIHQQLIYGIDEDDNNIAIKNSNINIQFVTNKQTKMFLVIEITNMNQRILYQLRDGSIFYRLSASNYFNRKEILYTQQMVNDKIMMTKKDYQGIIDLNMKTYTIELNKKEQQNIIEKQELLQQIVEQKQLLLKKENENKELLERVIKQEVMIIKPSICQLIYMWFK